MACIHLGINKGKDMVGNNAVAAGRPRALANGRRPRSILRAARRCCSLARPDGARPEIRQAGQSPFMDMMLVPVYADGDGVQGQVE